MPDNLSTYAAYKEAREKQNEEWQKFNDKMRTVANRIFSTDDGIEFARGMMRYCRLFEAESRILSDVELQRLQAQKDFVNTFITRLIDRKTFIKIIEGI